MTNREALEALARNERLDQATIKRLLKAGLITSAGTEATSGQREHSLSSITLKGQRLVSETRGARNKSRGKKKKRFPRFAKWVSRFEIKALLALVPLLAIYLTYKYAGADDLRTKVYSPLNAELAKIDVSVNANSVTQPLASSSLDSLRHSGDFYRMPKSLQRDVSKFYKDAGGLQASVSNVTELLQRQFSSKIQAIRSEHSDEEWRLGASERIQAEDREKPGISTMRSFTFNHALVGRSVDVRNPNNPIVSGPGGPIWQINDWLSYPESLEKVSSIWGDDDYLYFDDGRDVWYYRITRADLERRNIALKDFLQPVYNLLQSDKDFKTIQAQQPELLKRLAALKAKIASRMGSPKELTDLLD